jgi:hypothetical protein
MPSRLDDLGQALAASNDDLCHNRELHTQRSFVAQPHAQRREAG